MGILSAIVQPIAPAVLDLGHGLEFGSGVGAEFGGGDSGWKTPLFAQ